MHGVCMTCTAMSGSGARTGLEIIHPAMLPILRGLHRARAGCIAAVAGTTTPGTAVRRIVRRYSPGFRAAATWASASPGHLSFWFLTFLPFGPAACLFAGASKAKLLCACNKASSTVGAAFSPDHHGWKAVPTMPLTSADFACYLVPTLQRGNAYRKGKIVSRLRNWILDERRMKWLNLL